MKRMTHSSMKTDTAELCLLLPIEINDTKLCISTVFENNFRLTSREKGLWCYSKA